MAKKRQGLTDDVSLDVKLLTGAKVSVKAKNLRTGAIKLVTLSIEELFETQSSKSGTSSNDEDQNISEASSELPISGSSTKFTGSEEDNSDSPVEKVE